MPTFSIDTNSNLSPMQQYSSFMAERVYYDLLHYDYSDPDFLAKLSVVQAASVQKSIDFNNEVSTQGFMCVGSNLALLRDLTTYSLEKGFLQQNRVLCNIEDSIEDGMAQTRNRLDVTINNLNSIRDNIRQLEESLNLGFNKLAENQRTTNFNLSQILLELRIPESQRQRRYHIEQGIKFLNVHYTHDALDEFHKALAIENKDYFAWQQVGYIEYQRHNFDAALKALKQFVHYSVLGHVSGDEIYDAKLKISFIFYVQREPYMAASYAPTTFLTIKYLSACNEEREKQHAAELLSIELKYHPAYVMRVFEDADMYSNIHIVRLIENLRDETVDKAKCMYNKAVNELASTRSGLNQSMVSIQSNIERYKDSAFYDKMAKHYSMLKDKCSYYITRFEKDLYSASQLIAYNTFLDSTKAIDILEAIESEESINISNLQTELEDKFGALFHLSELDRDYQFLKKFEQNQFFVEFVRKEFRDGYYHNLESLIRHLKNAKTNLFKKYKDDSSYSYYYKRRNISESEIEEYIAAKRVLIQILNCLISNDIYPEGNISGIYSYQYYSSYKEEVESYYSSYTETRYRSISCGYNYSDAVDLEYFKLAIFLSETTHTKEAIDFFIKCKNYLADSHILYILTNLSGKDKYLRRAFKDAKRRKDSKMAQQLKASLKEREDEHGGCYIATAIYGSYDAPEVMVLRYFRDNTLKKSWCGRVFIRVYYVLSPTVARRLSHPSIFNRMAKGLLNRFVELVKRKISKEKATTSRQRMVQ